MPDALAAPSEALTPVDLAGIEFQDGDVLLIVDPARDLFSDGPLPVAGAEMIVDPLNRWIATFRIARAPIIVSLDWHPPRTFHFVENGGPWPPHCLAGSPGAMPHPDLIIPSLDDPSVNELTALGEFTYVMKGFNPNDDGYTAFDGKTFIDGMGEVSLLEYLAIIGGRRIFVGGLATDYCVKSTVLDALSAGIEVFVILDAVAAVDYEEGSGDAALEEMQRTGAGILVIEDNADDPDVGKYVLVAPASVEPDVQETSTPEDPDIEAADEAAQDEILAEGEDVDAGDVVDQGDAEGSTGDDEETEVAVKPAKAPRKRRAKTPVETPA